MYQLSIAIALEASWHITREQMYIGQRRDISATYTRARHIRVLEQRGVITLRSN